jgi:hypothetical protein
MFSMRRSNKILTLEFILQCTRTFYAFPAFKMNSTASTFQTSYAEGGVTGVDPKQATKLRDLKLNDGNEIPMVSYV